MPREPTFATDALDPAQIAAYLTRIELAPALADSAPSLKLLSDVYLNHHLHVPKDTTSMHVTKEAWNGPSQPIVLGSSLNAMPLRTAGFDRIVRLHAGGYCWANNPTFAALLRGLGFRVSEVSAKVYKNWANLDTLDKIVRNRWGTITHVVLVVDWPGSGDRYVLDVGFGGGGCPIPMPLRNGATVLGLNPYEAWTLRHEPLPHDPEDEPPIDVIPGYTMYRRTSQVGFCSVPDADTPSTWTHQLHFLLASVTIRDIGLFDFYSQGHPLAAFTGFFLVTRLLPGGARRSLIYSENMACDGKRLARVYTTGGLGGDGPRDVEYVPMETGPMRAFLEREFGFVFE
ncbi:arylamine N-acetyltransferase 1 [Roridomyces roridus]|uniref:Arylamine N-acetyltransferase 1 n=1 Tax=Roridomyces roridus TaxID=1738132 RepID=A0AAD7G0D2_9AGAR|nr:arylamine N-acetyltransferase 1 [Roridomyces roridus]